MSTPDSTTQRTVAQADDPYAAMLRGSLLPTLAVGAVAVLVAVGVAGAAGLVGAVLALVVVVLSFSATLLVMRWAAKNGPANVMAAALATYMGKVLVLGVFLVLFGRAAWLDGVAFGITLIGCAVVWLVFEARAYYRMRTLVFGEQVLPGAVPSTPSAPTTPSDEGQR